MTDLEFVNVVQRGISPEGENLIPALPYTSYAHMKAEDVLDIRAYLATLAPVKSPEREADLPAAFLVRRGVGLWKWIGLDTTPWQPDPAQSESWNRGSYLVNGPGHCAECHTPRNIFMALDTSQAFQGGPHPEGDGKVPSLRGLIERGRYKDAADIASALQYGEIMGYDKMSSGGMGKVQQNISKLPEADIKAIASTSPASSRRQAPYPAASVEIAAAVSSGIFERREMPAVGQFHVAPLWHRRRHLQAIRGGRELVMHAPQHEGGARDLGQPRPQVGPLGQGVGLPRHHARPHASRTCR